MCATCGCSQGSQTIITDMQNNQHIRLDSHDHGHDHEHGHGHEHGHSHDQDHGHSHDHSEARGTTLHLEQGLMAKNDLLAERNRGWLDGRDILALNLMSSPGSGKTTLLERTIRDLGVELNIQVIEGDQATTRDAERIRATGCHVIQVNTGAACHLDAEMIGTSLRQLDPPTRSTLMIENVGNLICPALFDLGERAKVVIASVTEGEDKPIKYPHMFRNADLVIVNKIDLLPYVAFRMEAFAESLKQVNPVVPVIQLSATSGAGLQAWYDWLRVLKGAK